MRDFLVDVLIHLVHLSLVGFELSSYYIILLCLILKDTLRLVLCQLFDLGNLALKRFLQLIPPAWFDYK